MSVANKKNARSSEANIYSFEMAKCSCDLGAIPLVMTQQNQQANITIYDTVENKKFVGALCTVEPLLSGL
jgi:hypothetical protein